MLPQEFFTQERLSNLREEIRHEGFLRDPFLSDKPDCPVFGVNLACAYPFPDQVAPGYLALAEQLRQLDRGVYVYPVWQTHVTILTLVNFARHQNPTPDMTDRFKGIIDEAIKAVDPIFDRGQRSPIRAFDLYAGRPVISRGAAIIPMSNPTGEIVRIRNRVVESFDRNGSLRARLEPLGLKVPPLIHSTIMRFRVVPTDTDSFLSAFDALASRAHLGLIRVNEILLTTEAKPYMRDGSVSRRFRLES
jgi:hypothetical protein